MVKHKIDLTCIETDGELIMLVGNPMDQWLPNYGPLVWSLGHDSQLMANFYWSCSDKLLKKYNASFNDFSLKVLALVTGFQPVN